MTPREKAEEMIDNFKMILIDENAECECGNGIICTLIAKKCAKLCVRKILSSNPHSTPFNTDPKSTFEYWFEVYNLLSE